MCLTMDIAVTEKEKMNDLISRQAAIDGKISIQLANGVEIYSDEAVPVEYLKRLPTIDAEPVIHCKDCKWYNGKINQCNAQICASMRGEDFCSKGERKDDG